MIHWKNATERFQLIEAACSIDASIAANAVLKIAKHFSILRQSVQSDWFQCFIAEDFDAKIIEICRSGLFHSQVW